jgi:Na+-translocating ferredoxin:NAD+ oxidoreductase subunit E
MTDSYKHIAWQGLWHNNPGLVQLLGLCPLLAVTGTVINGLGLGIASTLILMGSNLLVSSFRQVIPQEIRIPVFVLIIASMVTCLELLMQAYYYELYKVLGIFIPLIVTNCIIIGRAEAFAVKHEPLKALWDGFSMGLGLTLALVCLGGLRELIGHGTLLAQADLLFGLNAKTWVIHVWQDYRGFLLAILPPGAFIGLGLLIALKNFIARRFQARQPVVDGELAVLVTVQK